MSKRLYLHKKNDEDYIFVCEKGCETESMTVLMDMVFDKRLDFDWEDAAYVAFMVIDSFVDERIDM